MPGNRKNFAYFTYVDDDGVSWNKRGESGGAGTAVDGHAAPDPANPIWEERPNNTVRKIIYMDPATGRTVHIIFYTAASYAAVARGDVVSVGVPGNVANINYAAVQKVPERKKGTPNFSSHLAD